MNSPTASASSWTSNPRKASSTNSKCFRSSPKLDGFFPRPSPQAPAKKSSNATTSPSSASPSCNAGRKTPDASSPSPASSPATPTPANAMSACTASRSTTPPPLAPTGNARKSPPNTIANACAPPHSPCGDSRPRLSRRAKLAQQPSAQNVWERALLPVPRAKRAPPSTSWPAPPADRFSLKQTPPAVPFSAIVPAPPDVEEYLIAGFLRAAPVELVKCETVDLEVPASSEIVLEGYVNLDELRTEGPFGDHTGFYSLADLYPVFHLTCITHRKDPIYATTIVGKPPMEDAYMGKAVERVFLPLMRLTIPELIDINLPIEGVFHNLMIVSIRKSYPGQARKVMNAIWSLGQAMFTKVIIVVDEDVDVQNIPDVTLKVLNHIDPERDIQFPLGPIDSLDHASRLANYGSKMGIDATRKWPTEGFTRPWPDEIVMDAKTKALVDSKWKALAKELGID